LKTLVTYQNVTIPNGNVLRLTRYQIVTCQNAMLPKYFNNVALNSTLLNSNVAKTNEQYTHY
jgi:hypothetical protein